MNRQKKHQLQDVFFISICAIICGADNWVAVEEFGLAKEAWFTELLGLEHGTLGALYEVIDTDHFGLCFSRWVADLANMTGGEVIAIDGKCLRRSIDKASKKAAIHMASAWAQQNNLVPGQVKVDDKSNEITAIPKLLSRLEIAGAVVTIDAMGSLQSIIAITAKREIGDKVTAETRYFISSLDANDPKRLGRVVVRAHWAIENNLHWVLDMAFDEETTALAKAIVQRIWLLFGISP